MNDEIERPYGDTWEEVVESLGKQNLNGIKYSWEELLSISRKKKRSRRVIDMV